MMLKRLALSYSDTLGFHVDMPSYSLVPGSYLPLVADIIGPHGPLSGQDAALIKSHAPSVVVALPDHTPTDLLGHIDGAAIRRRYSAHSHFGSDSWSPPAEVKG